MVSLMSGNNHRFATEATKPVYPIVEAKAAVRMRDLNPISSATKNQENGIVNIIGPTLMVRVTS